MPDKYGNLLPGEAVAPRSDSSVAELQRVLTTYAQITGFTPANPGPVDGIVGIKTTLAVVAMLPRVPGLPSEVTAMAPVIALLLATTDGQKQAFGLIQRNASTISRAIIALEAYRIGTASGTPGTTPTTTSIKTGRPGGFITNAVFTAAPTPDGAGVPTNPSMAIWFYDSFQHKYRVAVPRVSLGSSYVDYVEVAPAASRPTFGTEVTRLTFMSAVGKWWASPIGIAAIAGGVAAAAFVAYKGVQAFTR